MPGGCIIHFSISQAGKLRADRGATAPTSHSKLRRESAPCHLQPGGFKPSSYRVGRPAGGRGVCGGSLGAEHSPEPMASEGLRAHVAFELTLSRFTGFQHITQALLGSGGQRGGRVKPSFRGSEVGSSSGAHVEQCGSCPDCVRVGSGWSGGSRPCLAIR